MVVISAPRYGFNEALRPLRKPLTPIKFLYATDLVYITGGLRFERAGKPHQPSTAPLDAPESLKLLDRQSLEQKPRDSDTGSMGEVYKD